MGKPSNQKIRIVLIGCGAISTKHVKALARIDSMELAGAFDLSVEAATAFEQQNGIKAYTDIDQLIRECDPHVIDVLTPSGAHAQTVLELAKYGRHFVVEKPLALRLDQIDRILEECDRRGTKIFVVKQNRFNPPVQQARLALEKGRFGKLVLGTIRVRWCRHQAYYDQKPWRGTWAHDGGVLTNQASHHIDLLIWMMGEVESVMAKTAKRLVTIEAEDTGAAILKFKNGALGIIEGTTATRPKDLEGSISILGEHGSVEIGGYFMNELKTWNFTEHDPMDEEVWEKHAVVPNEFAWNHTEFFRDVADSLAKGRKGLIDGLEGRKSVEIINAIYESAETGKEIPLRFSPSQSRLGIHQ